MSTLTALDKTQLEDLLGMSSGYVLDFTNRTFAEYFRDSVGSDIDADKYALSGDSKANRLRVFWRVEPDEAVGKVLLEILKYWRHKNPNPGAAEISRVDACNQIVERLLGKQVYQEDSEMQFLKHDFGGISLRKVQIDSSLLPILESRLSEATLCLENNAPLAVIFLCGSILEGLLLGVASANPQQFNQSSNNPKQESGKVKQFQHWTLAEFIDTACELGYLNLNVKKFSHALRDFRNYIHPYEQMSSGFNPDKHTAEICLQVLKAAIASLSGQKN